ncbi:hypothetical protein [Clostridium septicum]|uniref:hypothetical protein n=1 Tax=Clostridium septicum TaxID=1504 RepID=UPI00082CD6CF|nr:hypothetical protein [Clostridium septicum]
MLSREESKNINLNDEIEKLKNEILVKDKEIKKYRKEIKELVNELLRLQKELNSKIKSNNRGAGRKSKFSEMEKEMIKMYRIQGKNIKELSEMFECSTGLIYKIIKN